MACKRMVFTILCVFCVVLYAGGTVASDNGAVFDPASLFNGVPVDILEGEFAGANAEFYFKLPDEWFDEFGKPLVTVTRITYAEGQDILDWYNIECFKGSPSFSPRTVMKLYVFDRTLYSDVYQLTVVMKTQDYVFAVDMGELGDGLTDYEMDIMSRILDAVDSVSLIKRCINLAAGQMEELYNAVIANGEVLPSPLETINGVYYIALREVCDAFGYDIFWDGELRQTTIFLEGQFVDEFIVDAAGETLLSPKFNINVINDRIYMAMAYYVAVLNKNISLDSGNNIIVSSKIGS